MLTKLRMLVTLSAVLVPLLTTILVEAQTTVTASWLGGNGNWSNNTLWNTGVAPNNTTLNSYDVSISPTVQSLVGLDQSSEISSLYVGSLGSLQTATPNHTVTVLNSFVNQGSISLVNSTFSISRDLINNGSFSGDLPLSVTVGGSLVNNGTFQGGLFGGIMLNVAGNVLNSSTMVNGDGPWRVQGSVFNSGRIDDTSSLVVGGNFSNTGTYIALGTSPHTIAGALNNTGLVQIGTSNLSASYINNSGVIQGNGGLEAGDVYNSGTIDISRLSANSYSQTGTWQEDFSSDFAFGSMDLTGQLDLSGILSFDFVNGYMPTLGQTFDFATFAPGELTGSFSSVLGNSFNNDQWMFDIDYDNNDGKIVFTVVENEANGVPEPATWAFLILALPLVFLGRMKFHF